MKQKVTVTYTQIEHACQYIYTHIQEKSISAIISLGRGGSIPGTILSHLASVPIYNFGISSYTKQKSGKISVYQTVPWYEITGPVLIVDDLSDSGKSLEYAVGVAKKEQSNNIFTSTCFIKSGTKFVPDFYYKSYPKDTWLQFPWEVTSLVAG